MKFKKFLSMGAGSWGTALSYSLADIGHTVYLWSYKDVHVKEMIKDKENKRFLAGFKFQDNLIPVYNWDDILKEVDYILISVPSHAFKETLLLISPFIMPHQGVIWSTKGFCHDSYEQLSQIADKILDKEISKAILTGPSFAKEVAEKLPTAVIIASSEKKFAKKMQKTWSSNNFRVYTSNDMIGVQVGGAVKNVLAIATGASDGLGFGSNTRTAIITRGLTEIKKLALKLGANKDTILGLACAGDLILTCTDDKSRNRRFGLALGRGKKIDEAISEIGQVVEGYKTSFAVYKLAKKYDVEMPIIEQIYKVLYENLDIREAVLNLMTRQLKDE